MKRKSFLFGFLMFALVILTNSCEIGLGAQVDTETPVFSFTWPNTGNPIVRDVFNIRGTWSDDGEIDKVEITFTKNDIDNPFSKKYVYRGKENDDIKLTKDLSTGEGYWSCLVDYEKDSIPDGSYSVEVLFQDKYAHKVNNTCQITVDNTAPIIVLQRPAAPSSDGTADSYGQAFTLVGQAADDNNVSLLDVKIYDNKDKNGEPYLISLNNVPNSINLDVAKYDETEPNNDYAKIYGSSIKNGAVQRYCDIIAYDAAQKYPLTDDEEQSEEDKKGNKRDYYYLYEDIATSVLSKYKITEVYSMYNGTYKGSDGAKRSAVDKTIKDVLDILEDENKKIKLGTFSLNPENNPTFTVAGRSQIVADGKFFENPENKVSNNSEVVIEVSVGLDSFPLREASLKPYAKECDEKGKELPEAQKIYFSETTRQKSGTSYKFVTKVSSKDNLKIGKNYVFGVEGKDENENDVMPAGKGYAFKLGSSGAAPVLSVTNPPLSINYLKKGDSLDIKGIVSVEDGKPDVKISLPDGSTKDITLVKQDPNDDDSNIYNYTYTITTDGTNGFSQTTSSEYKYVITAKQDGLESKIEKTVMYDVKGPNIEILSMEPIAQKYDSDNKQLPGDYLNGTVKARISISDEFDAVNKDSIKWEIIQNDNIVTGVGGNITKVPTEDIQIDTTKIPDGKITLKITADDRAGNRTIETKEYEVDQSTDLPRIIPNDSNTNFTYDTRDKMDVVGSKINKVSMGGQLILKYYDDDGVKSIEIRKSSLNDVTDSKEIDWNATPSSDITTFKAEDGAVSGVSGNITYNLPNSTGYFAYKIKIFDTNEGESQKSQDFGPFIIKMTSQAPNLSTVKTSRNYSNSANSTTIKNTVEFGASEFPVYLDVSTDGGNTWTENVATTSNTNATELEHTLSSSLNATTTFTYRIRDKEGITSNTKNIECKIDNEKPTITIEKLDNKTKKNALSESPYRFEGTISDNASGVDKAYYIVQPKTASAPVTTNLTTWSELELGSGKWYKEIEITQGLDQKIYVCATDEAGNISEIVSKEFDVDFTSPTLNVDSLLTTITNANFTISGTASDTLGLNKVTLKIGEKTFTPTVGAENKWSQTFTVGNGENQIKDGDYTIVITATDNAEKTTIKNVTMTVDITKPTLSFDNDTQNQYVNSNSITYSGTITETNFASASLQLLKDDLEEGEPKNIISLNNDGKWSETFYNLDDDCQYTLKVTVKDKAGNTLEKTTAHKYIIDRTSPETTFVARSNENIYDENANKLALNSPIIGNSNFASSAFTIGGTITETNFASAEIYVNNAKKTFTTGGTSSGEWTYAQNNTSGKYEYKIVIKDKANNQKEEIRTVTIDTVSPTISISTPTTGKTGTESLTDNTFNFTGNANDGENGTGVVKLLYKFTDSASAPTSFEEISANDGNWKITKEIETGTSALTSGNLYEGKWYLHIKAKDMAGNESTVETRQFDIDKAEPKITTKYSVVSGEGEEITDTTKKVKLEKFGLKITVEDTNTLDSTTPLLLSVKNGETTLDSSKYSFTKDNANSTVQKTIYNFAFSSNSPDNGDYIFEFTGKDICGKTTTVTRNITLDTNGPTITIVTPDFVSWQQSKTLSIKGSADDLSGVSAVYYALNPSTSPSLPTNTVNPATWTPSGFTKATGTTSWTISLSEVPENNSNTLYIWAVDKNGIVSGINQTIKVDATNPTLTETKVNTTGKTLTTGSLILGGEVSDAQSGLQSLIIKDSLNESNSWTVTLPTSGNSWTQTISLGNENSKLKDGEHVLTITATDNSGRISTLSRNIKIDTNAPTVGTTSITTTGNIVNSVKWYNTQQIAIKVEGVTDNKKNDYASGISSVEYSVNSNDENSVWTSLIKDNSSATTWTGTAYCSNQGKNEIYIRVKDVAGNVTTPANSLNAYIDTLSPSEPSEYSVDDESSFVGQKLINGRNDIKVELTVSDDTNSGDGTYSGIKSVTYTTNDNTKVNGKSSDNKWIITIPKGKLSSSQAVFTITDNAGNTREWKPFSFNMDNSKPSVKINPITDSDTTVDGIQVNGTITVSGTATDNQGLATIDLVAKQGSTEWKHLKQFEASGVSYPWSYDVDTTTFPDETDLTFAVIVTDTAGNRNFDTISGSTVTDNTKTITQDSKTVRVPIINIETIDAVNKSTVKVSQDSDRPIITLTSCDLSTLSTTTIGYSSNSIIGTISDDDGNIKNFYYATENNKPTSDAEWQELTLNGPAFTLSLDDGSYKVWFKVVDANNKTFTTITTSSDTLSGIKLKGNENDAKVYGTKTNFSSPLLNIMIDTKDPEVWRTQYIKKINYPGASTSENYTDYATYRNATNWNDSISSATFGGEHNIFKLSVLAYDSNGIKSVQFEGFNSTYNFTSGNNTVTYNGKTYVEWISPEINVKDFATTVYEGELITTDNGNRSKTNSITITVDNTNNPTEFFNPSDSEYLYGDIQAQGTASEKPTIFYAVSTSNSVKPGSATSITTWKDYTDSNNIKTKNIADISNKIIYKQVEWGSNWYIDFDITDGNNIGNSDGHYHDKVLTEYLYDFGITTDQELNIDKSFDSIVGLYLWIKTVDEVGNVSETCRLMQYDPNGDRPSVAFSYPKPISDPNNYPTVGGKVRVTGSANVPIGNVTAVYLQIADTDDSNDQFTQADLNKLYSNGYTIKKMSDGSAYNGGSVSNPEEYGIETKLTGYSWSLEINNNGEFNVDNEVKNLAIHAYAYNGLKPSKKTTLNVKFDANNPTIGGKQRLYLIQSADDNITSNGNNVPDFHATSWKEYESEMFVRGDLYLIGSVEDDDGIDYLKINNSESGFEVVNADSNKTKYFKYKISKPSGDGVAHQEFEIEVKDRNESGSGGITRQTISINHDNKAPVLIGADTEEIYDINPNIVQKDGYYSLASQASELPSGTVSQSGVKYVAFYFVRRNKVGTEEDSIYNPMLKVSDSSNKTIITNAIADSNTTSSGTVYKSGLYWNKQSVTRNENALDTITISSADKNCIRKGGLVEIAGTLYTIKEVNGSTVSISGNPPASAKTAYFAYAQVVDNRIEESNNNSPKNTNGYPTTISNDDGDGMEEYLDAKTSTVSWTATIVSKNIPDGPIEVHYTVFDAAGNYSIGIAGHQSHSDFVGALGNQTPDRADYKNNYNSATRTSNYLYVDGGNSKSYMNNISTTIINENFRKNAFVTNNAPRLAGVTIWTDYNGNSKKDEGESITRYYSSTNVVIDNTVVRKPIDVTDLLIVSGASEASPQDYNNGGQACTTIRDATTFTPEIIGGNGLLNYSTRIGSASAFTNNSGFAYNKGNTVYPLYAEDGITSVSGNDDSEGYITNGYVNITENHKKGVIKFDGTHSANSNSATPDFGIFGSSNSTITEPTWFEYKIWDSTEGTTTGTDSLSATMRIALAVDYFDSEKPTVAIKPFHWSGKGLPTGFTKATDERYNSIAWDENQNPLGHIELSDDLPNTFTIGGSGLNDKDPKVSGKIVIEGTAQDNIRLKSVYAIFDDISSIKEANTKILYSEWKTSGSASKSNATDGWTFTVTEDISDVVDGIDTHNHKVKWTLEVDTSKVTNVAGLDKKVHVIAIDERGNTFTGASSVDTTYQMDIVPYITRLVTSLSTKKRANPSVYDRTVLGHYPVYTYVNSGESNTSNGDTERFSINGFNITTTSDNVGFNRNSGEYEITTNGITSLNNKNNNEVEYNKQPNGDNNNILIDDVILDVWQLNNSAAKPKSGKANDFIMKINPSNGMLGFAFSNGSDAFSMPNGTTNSYTRWIGNYADYKYNAFTYSTAGVAHSLTVGLDTEPSAGYAGRLSYLTSQWGTVYPNRAHGNFSNHNVIGLDSIGVPNNTFVNGNQIDRIIDTERLRATSIGVAGTDTNTRVYVAYYDDFNKHIRFRWGINNRNGTQTIAKGQGFNQFIQTGDVNTTGDANNSNYNSHGVFETDMSNYSIIAGQSNNHNSNTGNIAGDHLDLAVITGNNNNGSQDVVCLVWFDVEELCLYYTYKTNPCNDNDYSTNHTNGHWSEKIKVFENAGEYCKIVIDGNGGIHIAAYDISNSDVVYAYLPSYDSTNLKTCVVDSYGIVGEHLTIDVGRLPDNNNFVRPVISYYDSQRKPKIAYLVDGISSTSTELLSGVDDYDRFTGAWEISMIPTVSGSGIRKDRFNVGLWKTSAGVIKNSTTGTSYATTTEGKTYGNGTANPILAYGVTFGTDVYIETAQKK